VENASRKLDTTQPMGSVEEIARTHLRFTIATSDGLKLKKGDGSSVKKTDINKG